MGWLSIVWNGFLDITGIAAWLNNRQQQKIGAQEQQNSDLKADRRINQAEVDASKTDVDWDNAAKKGDL